MSKELDNYVKAFEIAPLTTFYKNSILVAIIATILNLLIFSMAAYVLVRCRFRFKGLITMLFSAALVIPGAALLQPLYQTLNLRYVDRVDSCICGAWNADYLIYYDELL